MLDKQLQLPPIRPSITPISNQVNFHDETIQKQPPQTVKSTNQ